MKDISANLEVATPKHSTFETFNLQLFAEELPGDGDTSIDQIESENNEGDVNPGGDPESDESNVLADEDVSEGQSKDKNHPANHVFAEQRRKNKELEEKLKEFESKQVAIDKHYEELALKAGRNDIKTEEDYRRALAQEDMINRYKETQDPLALVELMKTALMPEIKSMVDKPLAPQEYDFMPEITDFNTEFGKTLKSIDEVMDLPNSEKIISYMDKNGLKLSEAYRLANGDSIKTAARQEAINKAKGHSHVKDTKQSADTSGHVDKAELDTFMRRHGITDINKAKAEYLEIKKLFD